MKTADLLCQFSIKKVLLVTDLSAASDAAFCESIDLCTSSEASLYILHVRDETVGTAIASGGLRMTIGDAHEDVGFSLANWIDVARKNSVRCEGTIARGPIHDRILETLVNQSCDIVVLGTPALHAFRRPLFDPTAEIIIRESTRPVYTVGPRVERNDLPHFFEGRVAVFVTDFHAETSEAIVLAARIARILHLTLHCLHVLPRALDDDHAPQLVQVIKDALLHLLAQSGEQLRLPVFTVAFDSEIAHAVVKYAREHHARVVVLGVRRQSVIAPHMPASIPYRIITEAICPVVTMAFPVTPSSRMDDATLQKGWVHPIR